MKSTDCENAKFNWRVVGDRIDNVVENTETTMNVTIATDVALKEVIFHKPAEFKDIVVGHTTVKLDNDSIIEEPRYETIPVRWEWIPRSNLSNYRVYTTDCINTTRGCVKTNFRGV